MKSFKIINCKGNKNNNFIDGRTLKNYYCIDCNNQISCQSALYGNGRCRFCATKGSKHPNYNSEKHKKHYCIDCDREIYYKSKRCHGCKEIGKLNPSFGKICPDSKRVRYKETWMRSKWEIIFAQWLSLSGIKWIYEPKRFYLKDFTYLPDFYLPEFGCYIEIKGWWRDNAKKRFDLFKKNYPKTRIEVLMKPELQELGILQ